MNDWNDLLPAPVELTIRGVALALTPLTLGELPAFARAIQPVASAVMAPERDWLTLLATHGEALLSALAIAVRQPRSWINALAPDAAIRLLGAVVTVNADFFVNRVLPALDQLDDLPGPLTSSSGSSTTATASPTS